MQVRVNPFVLYSPDEPTGGGEPTFEDPGSWGLEDVTPTEDGAAPSAVEAPTTGTPDADSSATGSAAPTPTETTEDTPAPGDQPVDTDKSDDKPASQSATTGEPTAEQLDALQAACDALGITETDPARQAEAIIAARAEITAQRDADEKTRVEQRQKAAEDSWAKSAGDAATKLVTDRLRESGWEIDTPNPWDDKTWEDTTDPEYGQKMAAAFKSLARSPEVQAYYKSVFDQAQSDYQGAEQRYSEMATKYAQHDVPLLNRMRDAGFSADQMEIVARSTHEHTQRTVAKNAAALAAAQKEITTLRGQVTGHDAALKQAREDGRAEGLKEALAEINAGRRLPNTNGLGRTSETAIGNKDVFSDPGSFTMDEVMRTLVH